MASRSKPLRFCMEVLDVGADLANGMPRTYHHSSRYEVSGDLWGLGHDGAVAGQSKVPGAPSCQEGADGVEGRFEVGVAGACRAVAVLRCRRVTQCNRERPVA